MKEKILVLMGGISGEREISILSGKACVKALRKKKYKVKTLDPKENFVKVSHAFNNFLSSLGDLIIDFSDFSEKYL